MVLLCALLLCLPSDNIACRCHSNINRISFRKSAVFLIRFSASRFPIPTILHIISSYRSYILYILFLINVPSPGTYAFMSPAYHARLNLNSDRPPSLHLREAPVNVPGIMCMYERTWYFLYLVYRTGTLLCMSVYCTDCPLVRSTLPVSPCAQLHGPYLLSV